MTTTSHDFSLRESAQERVGYSMGARWGAVLSLAFAAYIAIAYAGQPLLDLYAFRQTQTALTSYWSAKEGFRLAYQTPVAGAPWSIPFEFPLFQWLVAVLARATGANLDAVGRLTSFAFLVACVFPARSAVKKLGLSERTFYTFIALLFSAPLYVYYGRSFMMETAALFFSIASIPFFLDVLQDRAKRASAVGFVLTSCLAILQKSTTELPVLAVLGIALALHDLVARRTLPTRRRLAGFLYVCALMALVVAVGYAWVVYTDVVKSDNALGRQLTSQALSHWNWGSLQQRITLPLYRDVVWERMFARDLAGWLGIALLAGALLFAGNRRARAIVAASLAAGLGPLFLFTNLHIHHDYYQLSCTIFLLFALAVAIGEWLPRIAGRGATPFVLALVLAAHVLAFERAYGAWTRATFDRWNSRDLAVAEVLARELAPGEGFIAFGNDWNSSFAYLSQRKSFTVPPWFRGYDQVLDRAQSYLGDARLGAVVLCPTDKGPTLERLIDWAKKQAGWRVGQVDACYVALRETQAVPASKPVAQSVSCEGSLDHVDHLGLEHPKGSLRGVVRVAGWTAIDGKNGLAPERIFITATAADGTSRSDEALRVPRGDVNQYFGRKDLPDVGFSGLLDLSALSGKVVVGVDRMTSRGLERCQFRKTIEMEPGAGAS